MLGAVELSRWNISLFVRGLPKPHASWPLLDTGGGAVRLQVIGGRVLRTMSGVLKKHVTSDYMDLWDFVALGAKPGVDSGATFFHQLAWCLGEWLERRIFDPASSTAWCCGVSDMVAVHTRPTFI